MSPKAVIYSRFSSELQRDASIEDQIRLCRARIEREGWPCQLASLRLRLTPEFAVEIEA